MSAIESLPELLKKKIKIFQQFEEITQQMYSLSPDTMLELVEQRGALLAEAAALDEEIREICSHNESIRPVINHQCDPTDLEGIEREIYEASLGVKAAANRIRENEEALRKHIELQKDAVLKRIENMNQGSYAVANQYYRSVQTGLNQPMGPSREKKV
ncbi:MAG: hypothetical protein VB085_10375 [Peptococcaceae bacterium]|nr:hypothetical protein [Peptococcaceae bacterium]